MTKLYEAIPSLKIVFGDLTARLLNRLLKRYIDLIKYSPEQYGAIALNTACRVSIPKGASAVHPFDIDRYLGTWYEIARMDFKYEKNLNQVTAK